MSRQRKTGVLAAVIILLLWTSGAYSRQAQQSTDMTARQPIRVGGNVQESKLRYRVEPAYPPDALANRVAGAVILQVTVNEGGDVSDVKVLRGHPLLDEAAVEAVRQWRYEPTLLNGAPVPVMATVTLMFSAAENAFRLVLDDSGELRDVAGQFKGAILLQKARESKAGVVISAAPRIPLRAIEEQVAALQREGIPVLRVQGYEVREGRLFSSISPDIQPPELLLDRDRLAAIAASSGTTIRVPPMQRMLLYRLFLSELGEIVAVEPLRRPGIPALEAELFRTRVVSPGRRGNEVLPVVTIVEIPIP